MSTTKTRRRAASPDLDVVLRQLYGAMAEDLSFLRCLDVVGTALRCHVSAVQHENYDERQSSIEVVGKIPKVQLDVLTADYASQWHGQNLWLNRGLPNLLKRGYGEGDEVVQERELVATPYYQHFLRRADVRFGLGICVWHDGPGKLAVATFNRARVEGHFDQETMSFVSALRPHLANAYSIYLHATHLADTNRTLRATMDRIPIGMLLMDNAGRVLQSNAEAERLFASRCGVSRNVEGRLRGPRG